ncbi:MAG: FadR/GntR family transcriptional regulator [Candidatus Limivicinus sp.]
MKFEAITAPTIGELFENRLQDMILSGELAIGEKLPTEQELADSMRISKSTVHNGIKSLERKGFLRITPRHGVYVANYPETGNLDTLIALLKHNGNRLDPQTISSILQFRESVEGMAVRLLAACHTTDQILRLRMYIEEIKKAVQRSPQAKVDELAQLLFEYHLYIGLKSGNSVIPMVLNGFHDVSIVFWQMWIRYMGIEVAIDFLEQFTQLIARGDGEGAMRLYRESAQKFMIKAFNSAERTAARQQGWNSV